MDNFEICEECWDQFEEWDLFWGYCDDCWNGEDDNILTVEE